MSEQTTNTRLRPQAARVEDLRAGSWVGCICDGCGHCVDLASEDIQNRVAGSLFVDHLGLKLRCEKCGERGRVLVNARRALGYG